MDSITGFAGKFFMKQKMGSVADSLPSMPGKDSDEKETPAKSSRQVRKEMADSRAERDAEYERKKAERAAKKTSMSDRWAANKSRNS